MNKMQTNDNQLALNILVLDKNYFCVVGFLDSSFYRNYDMSTKVGNISFLLIKM